MPGTSRASASFDGGILEISTDSGNSYNNVTSAGGRCHVLRRAGPNHDHFGELQQPGLAGSCGWVERRRRLSPTLFPAGVAQRPDDPFALAGWFDSSTAATNPNWRIDSVSITGGTNCTTGRVVSALSATSRSTLAYAPTSEQEAQFTGVTTLGSSGTGSITVTPSGGSGTGNPRPRR